jgi:tRNA(fMet)-specific endonuclease VapC
VIPSPDASVHARYGHGELRAAWSRTGRGTHTRTPAFGASISSITLAELRFGAEARRSRKLHSLIGTFVESVAVLAFDQRAADRFATVAASLARRGEPIGSFDTLMAAHALSLGLTFVTNNTQHFRRVVGLTTENWV